MRRLAAVIVWLASGYVLEAQLPIGHATPIGAFTPSLSSEPVWLGNGQFGYGVHGGPPGGSALIVVSGQRQNQMIAGLQVYPDLGYVVMTHTATLDSSGDAFVPLPLPGPSNPAIAGVEAWVQAAVTDPASPGSLGATQGLLLELTLDPLLALPGVTGLDLLDPFTAAVTVVAGFPQGTTVADVTFANGGRDLFVAADQGLFLVDTLAATPSATALPVGTQFSSLAWDRVHHRLYALSPVNFAMFVIDGDRASASFGSVLTMIPGLQQQIAISADGNVLAALFFPGGVGRWNAEPLSPAYLQALPTATSPIVFAFGTSFGRLHVSPDGRVVSVPVTSGQLTSSPSTQLHRLDGDLVQWIDHDLATPGYQPLSQATHPAVPPTFMSLPSRDGRSVVLAGSSVVQVALNLSAPSAVVVTPTPVAPIINGHEYPALHPSGRFLVQRDYAPSTATPPVAISLVEVASGAVFPWTVLTSTGVGISRVPVWR